MTKIFCDRCDELLGGETKELTGMLIRVDDRPDRSWLIEIKIRSACRDRAVFCQGCVDELLQAAASHEAKEAKEAK